MLCVVLRQKRQGGAAHSQAAFTRNGANLYHPPHAYQEVKEKEIDCLLAGTFFQWLPFEGEKATELIVPLEAICIALGNYPLNIDGNCAVTKDWLEHLKTLRQTSKKPK